MPRHSELISASPKHKEIAGHSSTTLTNHARNDMRVLSALYDLCLP